MKLRNCIFVVLLLLITFQGASCFAQASGLAAKICDIRVLFCGGGGLAVVGFAIGMIGLMVLNGKMHWSVLLISGVGIIIFMSADQFVNELTGDTGAIDSNCECL